MSRHSVIIGSYNRPHLVQLAIESVVYAFVTYQSAAAMLPTMSPKERAALGDMSWMVPASLQLLITDDGSDAQTVDILARHVARLNGEKPRHWVNFPDADLTEFSAELICGDPAGVRAGESAIRAVQAINRALSRVDGDFVHYLSDDDLFTPPRLMQFQNHFHLMPQSHMAYGKLHVAQIIETMDAPEHAMRALADRSRRIDRAGPAFPLPYSAALNYDIYPGHDVVDPIGVLDQKQVVHRASVLRDLPAWPTEDIGYCSDGHFFNQLVKKGFGPIHALRGDVGVPIDHVDMAVAIHMHHPLNLLKTKEQTTEEREPAFLKGLPFWNQQPWIPPGTV